MQTRLQNVTSKVQLALRLSAIETIERREAAHLLDEASLVQQQAQAYQNASQEEFRQAMIDSLHAKEDADLAQQLLQAAQLHENEVIELWNEASHNDKVRVQTLANMAYIDNNGNQQTETDSHALDKGMCSWNLVSRVCEIVGGASKVGGEAVSNYNKYYQKWHDAIIQGKQSMIDSFITAALNDKGGEYEEMAEDLNKVASLWNKKAVEDTELAQRDHSVAEMYYEEEDLIEQRLNRTYAWIENNSRLAANIMQRSEVDQIMALRYDMASMVLAIVSAVFFVCSLWSRLVASEGSHVERFVNETDGTEIWRRLSYSFIHCLVLLGSIGSSGMYLYNITSYHANQRGAVFCWIAFMASFFQTLFLHGAPQIYTIEHWDTATWKRMGSNVFKIFVLMFFCILMETVIMWQILAGVLLEEGIIDLLRQPVYGLCCILVVALHIILFEPRSSSTAHIINDGLTVTTDEEVSSLPSNETICISSYGSGSSPVKSYDAISDLSKVAEAKALLGDDGAKGTFGESLRSKQSISTRHYVSPYDVSFVDGMYKLVLLFEVSLLEVIFPVGRQ